MKLLKTLLVFLVFFAIAAIILSLVVPAKQKIEKTITIEAHSAIVYGQLSQLKNLSKWWVWASRDSTARYDLSGTDGTTGASLNWNGDPEVSGQGRVEITALEPGSLIRHTVQFLKPHERKGISTFQLNETNGITSVTWTFEIATPRPWNIFNLFYSLDKEMGKDFEEGLAALKTEAEKSAGTAPARNFTVDRMDFPATRFAMIRQQVKWIDMSAFFQQHIPILFQEAGTKGITAGNVCGLFFGWDEKNQQADMAAAIPIPAGSELTSPIISMYDVPASKAVFVNYQGSYDKEQDAYNSIRKYLSANGLKQKGPSIEQYITGPFSEKDTAKWITKIVFLVE